MKSPIDRAGNGDFQHVISMTCFPLRGGCMGTEYSVENLLVSIVVVQLGSLKLCSQGIQHLPAWHVQVDQLSSKLVNPRPALES